jgi:hypothetical protein
MQLLYNPAARAADDAPLDTGQDIQLRHRHATARARRHGCGATGRRSCDAPRHGRSCAGCAAGAVEPKRGSSRGQCIRRGLLIVSALPSMPSCHPSSATNSSVWAKGRRGSAHPGSQGRGKSVHPDHSTEGHRDPLNSRSAALVRLWEHQLVVPQILLKGVAAAKLIAHV